MTQTGIMAEFTVKATRLAEDRMKVQLVIHNNQVIAELNNLPLLDKTYEYLFDIVAHFLQK